MTIMAVGLLKAHAVLKERDLDQTLEILRSELTAYHHDLTDISNERKQQNEMIFGQLMETMKQSNQNSLMLYSQKQNYVFDMTYACHQATEQYHEFRRSQIPFQQFFPDDPEALKVVRSSIRNRSRSLTRYIHLHRSVLNGLRR